jgi:hypothetical protein
MKMNPELNWLTDDLSPSQFQALLQWLWQKNYAPTLPNVARWRKLNNLN